MQAMVHAKTCIQCGLCPAVCPDVFTLDPGEPARAISGPVPEECRLAAQEDSRVVRGRFCAFLFGFFLLFLKNTVKNAHFVPRFLLLLLYFPSRGRRRSLPGPGAGRRNSRGRSK